MTLYHGTNADIDAIDLSRSLRHKDRYLDQQYFFGTEQALRFLRKTNVETL